MYMKLYIRLYIKQTNQHVPATALRKNSASVHTSWVYSMPLMSVEIRFDKQVDTTTLAMQSWEITRNICLFHTLLRHLIKYLTCTCEHCACVKNNDIWNTFKISVSKSSWQLVQRLATGLDHNWSQLDCSCQLRSIVISPVASCPVCQKSKRPVVDQLQPVFLRTGHFAHDSPIQGHIPYFFSIFLSIYLNFLEYFLLWLLQK